MLNHPTLDQLKTLKLDGMAEAFSELDTQDGTASLSHAEWLGLLVEREASSRATKRFESRIRTATLRHNQAVPEDVDYRARRNLDKALFQQLLTGKWIRDKRNLIITGPCGVGKISLTHTSATSSLFFPDTQLRSDRLGTGNVNASQLAESLISFGNIADFARP